MKQDILDWLFRFSLYRGIRVKVPHCMFLTAFSDGQFAQSTTLSLNADHPMVAWLMDDCDGPWKVRAARTDHSTVPSLSFARVDDAVIFSLLIR